MKNTYSEQKTIKIIGTLQKTDDGSFICTVSNRDMTQIYSITDILEQMVGTEICLQNVEIIEEI